MDAFQGSWNTILVILGAGVQTIWKAQLCGNSFYKGNPHFCTHTYTYSPSPTVIVLCEIKQSYLINRKLWNSSWYSGSSTGYGRLVMDGRNEQSSLLKCAIYKVQGIIKMNSKNILTFVSFVKYTRQTKTRQQLSAIQKDTTLQNFWRYRELK